jgi:hypothetical protein
MFIPDPGVKKASDPRSGSATLGRFVDTRIRIIEALEHMVPDQIHEVCIRLSVADPDPG